MNRKTADALKAKAAIDIPKRPNPRCKSCYGRGHIGENIETGRWRTCPRCYPNTAETKLPPLELIEKLEAAARDPEMVARIQGLIAEREMMEADDQ